MAAWITLDEAKDHLRVTDTNSDTDIARKVDQACSTIYIYMKAQADAGWLDGSVVPSGPVLSATYLLLTHLYENRGDDMKSDAAVWQAIQNMLVTSRDPALA